MVLEVVEGVLEDAIIHAVLVFIGFAGLLPSQVDE